MLAQKPCYYGYVDVDLPNSEAKIGFKKKHPKPISLNRLGGFGSGESL